MFNCVQVFQIGFCNLVFHPQKEERQSAATKHIRDRMLVDEHGGQTDHDPPDVDRVFHPAAQCARAACYQHYSHCVRHMDGWKHVGGSVCLPDHSDQIRAKALCDQWLTECNLCREDGIDEQTYCHACKEQEAKLEVPVFLCKQEE